VNSTVIRLSAVLSPVRPTKIDPPPEIMSGRTEVVWKAELPTPLTLSSKRPGRFEVSSLDVEKSSGHPQMLVPDSATRRSLETIEPACAWNANSVTRKAIAAIIPRPNLLDGS